MSEDAPRREQSIETWMLATVQDAGIERFDDLHIDKVDSGWGCRTLWMQGAQTAHQLALKLRDRHHLPVTVAVAFSLEPAIESTGVSFETPDELLPNLDWSPPSLYLFKRGLGPWDEGKAVQELDPARLGVINPGVRCFYIEFEPADTGEYRRSVYLTG